jgi:hypothetical protein
MTVDQDPVQASDVGVTPIDTAAAPSSPESRDAEAGDLLLELSRAMHRAALAQHKRMAAEVGRLRSTQGETIKARAAAEAAQLQAESDQDIREIDEWAQTATELIAAERVRRIDARRERLQAQLARQDVISQRELMAVEVSLEDHEAALESFFSQLETETDPATIARLAPMLPPLPSLSEAMEAARRHAIGEFPPIEDASPDTPDGAGATEAAIEVSTSRLMAVMDPDATQGRSGTGPTPWPEPRAVVVAAGAGGTDATGSTPLLRTTAASRPFDRATGVAPSAEDSRTRD